MNNYLRNYIVRELDSILLEGPFPNIARNLTKRLRDVVEAWPNVTVLGVPAEKISPMDDRFTEDLAEGIREYMNINYSIDMANSIGCFLAEKGWDTVLLKIPDPSEPPAEDQIAIEDK